MARTARNARLDSRTARTRLAARREPYWTTISRGCHIGYRRGATGGSWIARYRDNETGKRHFDALGAADDIRDADGITVFSFAQAQTRGREYFDRKGRELSGELAPDDGTFTVADALTAYMASYTRRNGKSTGRMQSAINAHILPAVGSVPVTKLGRKRIADWHEGIAQAPPQVRRRRGQTKPAFRPSRPTAEAKRQRKSTANRVLTILKSALSHALADGRISCRPVWEIAKPFRNVESARIRIISDDESRRLANASQGSFRTLVTAALITGCRYGELVALTTEDMNAEGAAIFIAASKSGKSRWVYLTDEGKEFFLSLVRRRKRGELLLRREDGSGWKRSDQQRPLLAACKTAKVPRLSFHELRHTYASRLVMRGVPLAVVAAQLGHADTRMVTKHYLHFAPNYVADTVRAAFGSLNILTPENVAQFRKGAA